MPPTTVLSYGRPEGGTPLMQAAPDFALELPLRLLVREGEHGKVYVTFNRSVELHGKHGLPPGDGRETRAGREDHHQCRGRDTND